MPGGGGGGAPPRETASSSIRAMMMYATSSGTPPPSSSPNSSRNALCSPGTPSARGPAPAESRRGRRRRGRAARPRRPRAAPLWPARPHRWRRWRCCRRAATQARSRPARTAGRRRGNGRAVSAGASGWRTFLFVACCLLLFILYICDGPQRAYGAPSPKGRQRALAEGDRALARPGAPWRGSGCALVARAGRPSRAYGAPSPLAIAPGRIQAKTQRFVAFPGACEPASPSARRRRRALARGARPSSSGQPWPALASPSGAPSHRPGVA